MKYDEFLNKNSIAKKVGMKLTIDKVSLSMGRCSFVGGGECDLNVLVNKVLNGEYYLSNPSKIANWGEFNQEGVKSRVGQMQHLRDITKNVKYIGRYTKNIPYPMLVLDFEKWNGLVLPLKMATDYDSHGFSITFEEYSACFKKNCRVFPKLGYSRNGEFSYNLTEKEFKTLIKDIVILGVLRDGDKNKLEYGRVSLVRHPEIGSNINCKVYTLEFKDDSDKIVTISAQCRLDSHYGVNDFNYYLKKIGEKGFIKLFENDIKNELNKVVNYPAADLFNYKICNSNSVIVSLKKDKTPLDLLSLDGFTQGYTIFKVELGENNRNRMAFIKDINDANSYFTISWGNSTSMVSDHYWVMQRTIMRCIRQKCLMLF